MYGFNPLRMEIARIENMGGLSGAYLDDIPCNFHQIRGGYLKTTYVTVSIHKPPYVEAGNFYKLYWNNETMKVRVEGTRLNSLGTMEVECSVSLTKEEYRKRSLQNIKDHDSPSMYPENNYPFTRKGLTWE